jgi:hypothetical protein
MAIKRNAKRKARATKIVSREDRIGLYGNWVVFPGELRRGRGRPSGIDPLFSAVAEKLPKDSLMSVCKHLRSKLSKKLYGVYVAHDSMGYPRYIGRGDIRMRLANRFKQKSEELMYFSFYVVAEKVHEREIETLLIHAAGPLLDFNDKKKRTGIQAGSIKDFEAGTLFYERRYSRGKGPRVTRG